MTDRATPIFRHQVSLTWEVGGLGRARVTLPRGTGVLSWLTVASVVALVAFMFLGTYTRPEAVGGILVPVNGCKSRSNNPSLKRSKGSTSQE